MRVLQVVTKMNRGGLETMLMNYYRHIDREKVQFDFLVHREERGAYDDEIESLGGKIYRLPRLVPWSISYLKSLDRFFDEHPEYKIVHVHQDCLSSVILKSAKKHGIPVRIAHSHNADQERNLKYPIKLWYMRDIPRYSTHLFACGRKAGDWMFKGAPYTVINNAIDPQVFAFDSGKRSEIREQLNIQNKFVIGHVGRFNPQKNHKFLLEIFSSLLKYKPDSVLLLVGGGDGMEKIENRAIELGISENVRFLGIRSDIADLMQAMDVFVFPSLYEGLPVTMVEAQAAGLPCVVSEAIPREAYMTDLVFQKKLSDKPDDWVKDILLHRNMFRTSHIQEVTQSGFDIETEAEKLQEFYLSSYEQNKQ